jgi:outer membrane protein OmpA-like peptidoglycan-associated protein
VRGVVLALAAVGALACSATASGESRALVPVVRDLHVRIVDPVASIQTVAHGVRLPGDVLFAFDDDQLGTVGERAVETAARTLDAQDARRLVVEGHTDARGKAAYNLGLARRRASTVAAALRRSMPGVRIAVRAYGETRPVASNATARGRSRNRRVEIRATS